MAELLTSEDLAHFGVRIVLQAVLGFDNLLYISSESKRAPMAQQQAVRRWGGILTAVALRIIPVFVMIKLIASLTEPIFHLHFPGIIEGSCNFATSVFLFGGGFIMYTAVREISHMLAIEDCVEEGEAAAKKSAATVIATIMVVNLIFSVDSILSALAITEVFLVLGSDLYAGSRDAVS